MALGYVQVGVKIELTLKPMRVWAPATWGDTLRNFWWECAARFFKNDPQVQLDIP